MAFDINAAKQAGYSDQEIQQYLNGQNQSNPSQGSITNAIQKTGLYDIPVLGGILRGATQPINSLAETAGADAAGGLHFLQTGQKMPASQAPFISEDRKQALAQSEQNKENPLAFGVKQEAQELPGQAGALLTAEGAADLPAIAKSLPELLGFLTKKGVGQKIGAKVAQATAEGANDTWNDFATEVKGQVAKKLGQDQPYSDIVNSRLNAEVPATLEENPTVDPQKLLDLRQQAANRIPKGIFQKFQGQSPADQVDEVIRQVASSRLKDLAGTGGLDKAYSWYSKFGSPASIVGRAAVGGLTSALVPDKYKAQAGGAIAGGTELLKILGIL